MTDAAGPDEAAPERPRKGGKTLLIALPVAVLLGGGAFYGVYAGLVPLPFGQPPPEGPAAAAGEAAGPDPIEAELVAGALPAFVPLEPMVISLAPEAAARHLKLSVQIEADPALADAVSQLRPRIADVLNTFMRAVEPAMLERPRSMARLRAQMLRRVQLVAPPGAVRDVLIQEFVLN
ncbi:flagellar basal body-associated FliL family protein [Paralimibaculum aggregatum]|uniref:Flagellar protein FliL n=1 Tax=Paralimibaculum aggregatum TaxID=3036245 RepID=A0ABQ6LPG4_9RHOB|nr:flagellar basal body-associated FliL family protein [Limibaculum sp. NKW23]GMG83647.1 flagellar basal body-associated FliL family protein [Limibaculum sp. NKW23]